MQSPTRSGAAAEAAYPELFHAQYHTALALRDAEGRLLGEGNSPRHLVDTAEIEWGPSRYPGSRYRHTKPINASALKQLTRHWDDLLVLVASARSEFILRYGSEGPLSASELWRFSRFTVTIPNYLTNRRDDPVAPDRIPTIASVAFKSIAGIFIIAADMFFRLIDLEKTFTPDDLIVYADDHGLFEGASGVCAGPPTKMKDLLTLVVTGSASPGPHPDALSALVGDVDSFFGYALLYTKLEFTKQVAAFALQERLADLYRTIKSSPDLRTTRLGEGIVSGLNEAIGGHRLQRRLLEQQGFRKQLVATLENELRRLEWSPSIGVEQAPQQPPPALRADDVLASVDQPPGGPERHLLALAAEALVDCVTLEKDALGRLQAICDGINGVLERPVGAVQLDHADVVRAIGGTPTRALAAHLGVSAGYDSGSAWVRHS